VEESFEKNTTFKLEYFQIADEETLLPCTIKNENEKYRGFIAVFVNNIRLIDTISFN
jgi:pantoate--beta-alanine ligase